MKSLRIVNIGEVATPLGTEPLTGQRQGSVEKYHGIDLLVRDGRIAELLPAQLSAENKDGVPRLDAGGGTVVPGFVDPHTHLPWGGSRETEFAQRLGGATYQEIAAAGGGILSTVRSTRAATQEELEDRVLERLDRMLEWGTTTVEAKSGYGLSPEHELRQLRALNQAAAHHPIEIVPTVLAAHETPPEFDGDTDRYVAQICEEILPAVAADKLARYCDVFCEQGVFTVNQSRRVLEAGIDLGMEARLHADEFVDSGGAQLAAEVNAVTADHLMAISQHGIDAMGEAGVLAGLLPGTSFFLMKEQYAPARHLLAAGLGVTLATDCNPGSSYTESMPMIYWLAVFKLGMTPEEALTAMTLNAAHSVGLADRIGTIEPGKQADLTILDGPNLLHLAYHFGTHPVRSVVKRGEVVYQRSSIR